MNTLSRAVARAMLPLAFGAFVATSTASAEPKVEDLKDYCGEINQLVTESQGWLFANSQELMGKYKTICPKLVLSMTNQALKDTAAKGMVFRTAKELGKALKELASTIGLPGGLNLEEALEKGLEKLEDAAKKKAKEELEKALKKLAGDHDPAAYRYTKEGKVDGCDYTMTVTWNINEQTFLIRTTGDCHCKVIKTREGEGKLGKWQSNIKGVAKINAKFGAGELVIGLDVTPESYSGAGMCNCDKRSDISYTPPDDTIAIVITTERTHEHRRERHREHRREHHREHDRKQDFARTFHRDAYGAGRGMGRMAFTGGGRRH